MSDEELCRIVQRGRDAMLANLPEPKDCHHEFTPQFEHKMNRLIRKYQYAGTYRTLKRVACFFAAIFLTSSVLLTTNAQAQGSILGWAYDFLFGNYHYYFDGNHTPASADVQYTLPEIPDGYVLYEQHKEPSGLVCNHYVNEEGALFSFEYILRGTTELFLSEQGLDEVYPVLVHGKSADFYPAHSDDTSSTLVWHDRETDTLLYVTGFFDEETLIALAESVDQTAP